VREGTEAVLPYRRWIWPGRSGGYND